jgi:hypothetical protein
MNTTSSVRMAHEYSASMESFERMTQIMRTEVSIQCSTGCNSIYDENDLHHALIALSIGNSYAESDMRRLALESSNMNVPSGSWLRDTVEKAPEEEMINRLKHALESTAASIGSFKLFNMPIMAAVDSHKIPRYDEKMEPFLRRSKYANGTSAFEVYTNLQCVEDGRKKMPIGL